MFFRMLALLPNEPAREPYITRHHDQRREQQKGQSQEPPAITETPGASFSRGRGARGESRLHGVITGLRWTGAVTHCKLAVSIVTRRPNSMPYKANPGRIRTRKILFRLTTLLVGLSPFIF